MSTFRKIAAQLGAKAVNPKWTSYGALEMDVFVDSEQDMQLLAAAVEPLARREFLRNLDEPQRFMPRGQLVDEARRYFDSERYWECHEVLESLWRVSEGDEKLLLQGIILVCASLVHHQKGEEGVAVGVARRALRLVTWGEKEYQGIDVARLRARAEEMAGGRFTVFKL